MEAVEAAVAVRPQLPPSYNAVDILERNLGAHRTKVALYGADRQLTFEEVSREVNQFGNALRRQGVRFGEHVAIVAPDSAQWVVAFFGTIKVGAVAVGVHTLLKPCEYEYILRDCRAQVLVVHESLLPALESARDAVSSLRQVVVIGQPTRDGDVRFEDWIRGESTELVAEPTHRDDFCSLNYSSGTTGEPKGVHHAHKDYSLIAELSGVELFGLKAEDRTFSTAKLSFVYGMGGNLILPWYVGASVTLYAGAAQNVLGVLQTIERFRPTVLFSVPTNYAAIMTLKNFASKYDLSSLRMCVSAGEALPASVWHDWRQATSLEILDTVGCTETLHTFMANRPGEIRPGSSGRPSPGYEARIVDDNGGDVPRGMIGNLLVKGPSTALSYLHQAERSRHTFRGEWLATGDQYYTDSDGYFWHAGRADDMLKVGGLWVSPVEIEVTLARHPSVLECAVVGRPDRVEMIKPAAYVVLRDGQTPSDELVRELKRFCDERLAGHKRPHWIHFIDQLPRTATGKAQRFKLRDTALTV